jgi:hypothetical protein
MDALDHRSHPGRGICVSGHAISINDILDLHVNEILQALGIGILVGFVIAHTRTNA